MDFSMYFQKVMLLWQGSIVEIDYWFFRVFGPYFIGKSMGTFKIFIFRLWSFIWHPYKRGGGASWSSSLITKKCTPSLIRPLFFSFTREIPYSSSTPRLRFFCHVNLIATPFLALLNLWHNSHMFKDILEIWEVNKKKFRKNCFDNVVSKSSKNDNNCL